MVQRLGSQPRIRLVGRIECSLYPSTPFSEVVAQLPELAQCDRAPQKARGVAMLDVLETCTDIRVVRL